MPAAPPPSRQGSLLLLLLLLLACLTQHDASAQHQGSNSKSRGKVAIVGAGVGGTYAAYTLSELYPDAKIDVFEASPVVGGRANSFELDGTVLELGGSIIWDSNLHLIRAAQRLGLSIHRLSEDTDEPEGFAVYDGTRFVLNQTGGVWEKMGMALRYGPSPLLYGNHVYKMWEQHFKPIYSLQDDLRRSYPTPEDMLQEMGMFNLTQHSCSEHMREFLRGYWWSWGSEAFMSDLAGAINRCNYNQHNEQLNAMAGLVSFLPASGHGGLWSVRGGNSLLAEALLNASGANLSLSTAVVHVQDNGKGRFSLVTLEPAGAETAVTSTRGPYDFVILATPLETSNISFQPHRPLLHHACPGKTHATMPHTNAGSATTGTAKGGTASEPDSTPANPSDISESKSSGSGGSTHGFEGVGLSAAQPPPAACEWVRCLLPEHPGTPGEAVHVAADHRGATQHLHLGETVPPHLGERHEGSGSAGGTGGGSGGEGGGSSGREGEKGEEEGAAGRGQTHAAVADLVAGAAGRLEGLAKKRRVFKRTVTTYVEGELQPSYFNVAKLPAQRVFVTNDASMPFSSIGPKRVAGRLVYKLFSSQPLPSGPDSVLERLFGSDVKVLATRAWDAYPRFAPPEKFAPFELSRGLCYVNTLESAASAMEMAAIGGKNCALMALEKLEEGLSS